MKHLRLIALLFSLLPVPVSAQTKESPRESGNAFVRLCSAVENNKLSEEEFGSLMDCVGYVSGFTEGVEYEAMYATARSKGVAPEAFCIPDDVEHGQLIRVVLKYIRDNPAEAHRPTAPTYHEGSRKSVSLPDQVGTGRAARATVRCKLMSMKKRVAKTKRKNLKGVLAKQKRRVRRPSGRG